jgi:hypothetical protein
MRYDIFSLYPLLLHPQNFWSSLLNRLLLLVASIERCCGREISARVVKVLDLEDADDPVLAGEGFLDGVEGWADVGHLDTADAVLALSRGEEGAVVVV